MGTAIKHPVPDQVSRHL